VSVKTEYPSAESDKMSAVEVIRDEMRGKVRKLAWPSEPGESVKGCIRRVSRATGLSFGQVKSLWYREWRRVPADVADRIREATAAHERNIDAQISGLRARQEQFWSLTHCSHDPEFYRGRAAVDGNETDGCG
jgi:hypothetical protein